MSRLIVRTCVIVAMGAVLALGTTGCATTVRVKPAPRVVVKPAPVAVVRPASVVVVKPRPSYVWVAGHWTGHGHHRHWVPGHYRRS